MSARRRVSLLAVALALIAPLASASSELAADLSTDLQLSYTPPCALCHQGDGGFPAASTPFAAALVARGLDGESSLRAALERMREDDVDSDGDGARDLDELSWGGDPNQADGLAGDPGPPPVYGCAIAGGSTAHGAPLALVFGITLTVVQRRRSRRRARHRRGRRALPAMLLLLGAGTASCSANDGVGPPRPSRRGTIHVVGSVAPCPTITSFQILPFSVAIGGDAQLAAEAVDEGGSTNLAFSWSTDFGAVSEPHTAVASFHCATPGAVTLTITVSNGACTTMDQTRIDCVPDGCGNGALDPGEACDDGNVLNEDGCSAQCAVE